MHRQEDFLQETCSPLKQTQARPAVDGERSLAGQVGDPGVAIEAKAGAKAEKGRARASILFIDDLRLTRDCMSELIADLCPEMAVYGLRAADYAPALRDDNAALVIFNLHGASISEAVRLLRLEARPAAPPVLFITNREQRRETMEAVECGAMGLVRADASIELLIAAIRLVIAGGSYFPAESITSLMAQAPMIRNLP